MSGKFMSVKRYIIPTITMVIIASQLCGCAAASQSELLQMINRGDQIEIEVAVPLNEEQGTEQSILWEQLASLTTNITLRNAWDDTLLITKTDTGKNGVLYVNTSGENDNNNTLAVALHNRAFLQYLESEDTLETLANAAMSQYVDIESEETMKAVYMGINGYFNLLPDAEVNYSNPDSTLTRAEFMSMVMRAETPVSEIKADSTFAAAVGNNDLNIYAQEVAEDNYLDLASKSLNNMTFNGTITRAEAVYLLMNHYFPEELANVNISNTTLSDCKDGGNIAEQQKFIEKGTAKDYWKSYELTYAISNPDGGVPTDLYKALVLAEQKGIISSETRWDEGITKAEAIEFLVSTLKADTSIEIFNFKQGTITGYEAPAEEVTENDEISKSEINDTDTQVADGTIDEDNVDKTAETPAPTETPAETPAPTEEPSTTEQEKTDFAKSLSEEEKESYKEILGLSEEEINQLTREEFRELVYKWMHNRTSGGSSHSNSGSSTGSGGSSNSSNSSNSSSSSNSAPVEGDADGDGLPDFQLDPDDGSLPGSM